MDKTTTKIPVYPVLLSVCSDGTSGIPADSSVLPLGMLIAYVRQYKEGALQNFFDIKKMVNRPIDDWDWYLEQARSGPAGIWLFSAYFWNYQHNLDMARQIKEISPDSLIVFGGPHVPAYEGENIQYFHDHPFIDITSRGEGEVTCAELLDTIRQHNLALDEKTTDLFPDFSSINGITFRKGDELIRTPDRVRNRELDKFPSPYISGELDDPSFNDIDMVVMETNRGCPFGCTFCDWGAATLQKFSLFDLDRIKQEIDIIARKRANVIYLGDSNFGAFERDVEIAQAIVDAKKKYGYPKYFGTSFAKNASPRLARIIKILSEKNMIDIGLISIQSTDENTLKAINRSNIKNEKYEQLIRIFRDEGLNLSSEVLIGLPGQTYETHKTDLQFFIDRKITTIAYAVAVMPNAPMNDPEYRKKYNIVTNEDSYVISTSTFTEADHKRMFELFMGFQFFYVLGALKYFLYFIQMEHGIRAIDFIEAILDEPQKDPERFPLSYKLKHTLLYNEHYWSPILSWTHGESDFFFNHLEEFFDEVLDLTKNHFHIDLTEKEIRTLRGAHLAVAPRIGKELPLEEDLPYNLVAYMKQIRDATVVDHRPEGFKPLSSFQPKKLKVRTLKNKTIDTLALSHFRRYTGIGWELKSELRFF
jgi:radical SAM superfamily enzyme YgiQ (UPF0313 family)